MKRAYLKLCSNEDQVLQFLNEHADRIQVISITSSPSTPMSPRQIVYDGCVHHFIIWYYFEGD